MRRIDVRNDRREWVGRRTVPSRLVMLSALACLPLTLVSGPAAAIEVDMKGDLQQDVVYHVYDGTLHLNAEISAPLQPRDDAFWIVFQPGGMPKSALPETATDDNALRHVWSNEEKDAYIEKHGKSGRDQLANLSCINQSPYYWTKYYEDADGNTLIVNGVHGDVKDCSVPETWIEWGQSSSWLDNPAYDLRVGPDPEATPGKYLVESSRDVQKHWTNFPKDIVWKEGESYVVRFAARSWKPWGPADSNDYTQRVIQYMGAPALKDIPQDPQDLAPTDSMKIQITPEDGKDYYLDNCTTTISPLDGSWKESVTGGVDKGANFGNSVYTAFLKFDNAKYKLGGKYKTVTECSFAMRSYVEDKPNLGIVLGGQKQKAVMQHEFTLAPTQNTAKKVPTSVTPPILTDIHGNFVGNSRSVTVKGKLAAIDKDKDGNDKDPKATEMAYNTADDIRWNPIPKSNIIWSGMSFSLTIPNAAPPDKPVSIDLQAKADNSLTGEAPVPFALQSFIKLYFLHPDTRQPIDEGTSIKVQGETFLRLKLVVLHPIDKLQSRLQLPDLIQPDTSRGGSVEFSAAGQKPEETHDMRLETAHAPGADARPWDGSDKPLLFTSKLLKPGDYTISVPVKIKKSNYRAVTWSVDAAKGDKNIDPHEVHTTLSIVPGG